MVGKVIGFDNYKDALDRFSSYVEMMAIRSNCHKIETDVIIKSGLCNFDDKMYCFDGISTFALE